MSVIKIDSREPQKVVDAVHSEVMNRGSFKVEVTGLETGDFVMGDVVIERKQANDYLNSITDSRLKQQEARMVADFTHRYVILEGSPYSVSRSNMHPNSVVGKQISSSANKNIKLIFVESIDQMAYAVWKIMKTHADAEETQELGDLLRRTKADVESTFVAMLSCIEGISQSKAQQMSQMFESISDMTEMATDYPENLESMLQEIEGVGPTLSKRVVDELK